jgi:DNA-binding protein HU-beta
MNKTDLINALSEETTFNKKDIARVLEAMKRILVRTLKKGGKVQWSGFGTFSTSCRPKRWGINPATKERIQLPEAVLPKFRAGKNFKEQIRSLKEHVKAAVK